MCHHEATLPACVLNKFYVDPINANSALQSTLPLEDWQMSVTTVDVRLNINKGAGPDNIPDWLLFLVHNHLADVFTDIFKISLSQKTFSTCLEAANSSHLPKKSAVSSLAATTL